MMAEAEERPRAFVSGMKVKVGDWQLKPVYQVSGESARVVGMLATPDTSFVIGENVRAVWYSRPNHPCDQWGSVAWTQGAAWDAVVSLKSQYGISSVQDRDWEVALPPSEDELSDVRPQLFQDGFVVGDPVSSIVANLPRSTSVATPSPRSSVIGLLQDSGQAVADVPFERPGPGFTRAFLNQHAEYFDATVGRVFSDAEMASLTTSMLATGYSSCGEQLGCTPREVFGEWERLGPACGCKNKGPFVGISGTFEANADGDVDIRIPWPPPLGTKIKFGVGVKAKLDIAICVWLRECIGKAQRTRKLINADCSETVMPREHMDGYKWVSVFWMPSTPAQGCATMPEPPGLPPATQDCGLEIPNTIIP
jgi:hypothetical protein